MPLVGQAGHGSSGTVHRYYHHPRKPKGIENVRPRLNADELEEKVLKEFKNALVDKGYFTNLEKTFLKHTQAKAQKTVSELERVQKELAQTSERIAAIWANQGRMQLSEQALRLASDEMNRLATQKMELEKYLARLNPSELRPKAYKEQALFVENQIRWCMQGWSKATPSIRKRLLRRTIKEIVITRAEMHITFWVSTEERDDAILPGNKGDSTGAGNLIKLRRLSPPVVNRNLSIESSGKVLNGSERQT